MNSSNQLQTLCLTTDQFADLLISDDPSLLSFASRRRHLEQCATCQMEYRRLEGLLGGLRESATVQSAAAQRKAQALPLVPRSHGTRKAVWSFATAALAVVVSLPFALHQRPAEPIPHTAAQTVQPASEADAAPAISDEALLDGITQDLSASVPSPLAPLDNPSNTSSSSDNIPGPNLTDPYHFNFMRIDPMNRTSLFRLASLAVLSCSVAFAQGPMSHGPEQFGDHGGEMRHGFGMGPGGMWWKNPDVVTKLGLTADQQKKMEDTFLQSRVQLIHIKATLEEEELMLRPLMDANPPDQAKALAQIGKIADTRADLEKANAKMLLGIRGVLTTAQWTTLQDMKHSHFKGGMGMGDRRGPDGQGGRPGWGQRGQGPGGPAPQGKAATPPPSPSPDVQ